VLCVVCCVLCVVRCALELHRFRRTSFEKLRAIDESANWSSLLFFKHYCGQQYDTVLVPIHIGNCDGCAVKGMAATGSFAAARLLQWRLLTRLTNSGCDDTAADIELYLK
jgi:hypothetical protein